MTPETALLLERGKLEQTCRTCGRWEAAHFACSWCWRPTGPDDWYRNGDLAERHGRMPATPPPNPPLECRDIRQWPAKWGPNPYARKAPRMPQTPLNGGVTPDSRTSTPDGSPTLGLGGLA